MRQALKWSGVFLALTLICAGGIAAWRGTEIALQFLTGYVIELSLSLDNVFAIALIFDYFLVPNELKGRVLGWGIFGAIAMRGVMICVGAELLQRFHWLLYALGAFLVFTGLKWGFSKREIIRPQDNAIVRLARRFFPVTAGFEGRAFFGVVNQQRALTPLALALIMVETSDIVFAADSIPAIFSVTQDPYIVLASNIFAILGLRSLYFILAGAMQYFRYLKPALAFVLIFIGGKMIASHWWSLPTAWSLAGVGIILGSGVALSVLSAKKGSP